MATKKTAVGIEFGHDAIKAVEIRLSGSQASVERSLVIPRAEGIHDLRGHQGRLHGARRRGEEGEDEDGQRGGETTHGSPGADNPDRVSQQFSMHPTTVVLSAEPSLTRSRRRPGRPDPGAGPA